MSTLDPTIPCTKPDEVVGFVQKSFLQALQRLEEELIMTNFLKPTIKSETLSIKISQEEYTKRLEECKKHLHGRLIMGKGDKSWSNCNLAKKLNELWSYIAEWNGMTLGKVFLSFDLAKQRICGKHEGWVHVT